MNHSCDHTDSCWHSGPTYKFLHKHEHSQFNFVVKSDLSLQLPNFYLFFICLFIKSNLSHGSIYARETKQVLCMFCLADLK